MNNFDLIIVGSGVSGLMSALHYANKYPEKSILVIEKNHEPGGFCRTHRIGEFVWDRAGHFFHFNNQNIKSFFEARINPFEIVKKDKHTVCFDSKGKKISFPHQNNWGEYSGNEQRKIVESFKESSGYKDPENFLELSRKRYGKYLSSLFLEPYNEKLYSCDLSHLDVDSMGRFLPKYDSKRFENVNISDGNKDSYNGSFLYPKNGSRVFIDVLLAELPENVSVMLNTCVNKIDLSEKNVSIQGRKLRYNDLISTIDLKTFLEISGLATKYNSSTILGANKVLVFNVGLDAMRTHEYDWIYFADKNLPFYRFGSYSNILNQEKESCYIEIGLANDTMVSDFDLEALQEKCINGLKEYNLIDKNAQVIAAEYEILNPGYCYINEESNSLVKIVEHDLKVQNCHLVGRYAKWQYCSIEDNMIEAINLVNTL